MENNNVIQSTDNEVKVDTMPTPKSQVHLETLVTPAYKDPTSAREIMDVLDSMINSYLRDTQSRLINVVQFGFEELEENGIIGFARIAVKRPTINWIMEKLKDSIEELPPEMTGEENNGDT